MFSPDKFARIISTIFIPPTNHLLVSWHFIFFLVDNYNVIIKSLALTALFGAALPLGMFFYLRKKGKIVNADATIKEERTFPYFVSIFIYALGAYLLNEAGAPEVLIAFWVCYSTTALAIIPINYFWKISAHSMGIAGPIAALFFSIGEISFLFLPLAFLVMWSRLRLKVHDIWQVSAGFLFGYFFTFFQMSLILDFWK